MSLISDVQGQHSARNGHVLKRGVWQAPFLGTNGEIILIAVDRHRRLVGQEVVPDGANRIEAADRLLAQLDSADPVPMLQIV